MDDAGVEAGAGATRVPLELREWQSGPRGDAEATVAQLTPGRRLLRASVPLGLAALLALALLPVPLMHLAGIPILGVGLYWMARNARAREVFLSASGTCPGCRSATNLFVGFGRAPYRLPVKTSCESCGRGLILRRRSD